MKRLCMLLAILLLASPLALADGALTNAEIIKMTKAGLANDIIVAKVQQAPSVDFKLETDDLIALKDAGVPQAVITAMLERQTAPKAAAAAGSAGFPSVSLVAASGTTALSALEGEHKQFAAPFVGLKHFYVFDGKAATVRVKDRKPSVEVALDKAPGDHWFLVKLDPDDDDPTRGLDLQSAGAWGGAHTAEPDEDFIIDAEVAQGKPGAWVFKPKKELKPGEYALYCSKGFLYDFGVDK